MSLATLLLGLASLTLPVLMMLIWRRTLDADVTERRSRALAMASGVAAVGAFVVPFFSHRAVDFYTAIAVIVLWMPLIGRAGADRRRALERTAPR